MKNILFIIALVLTGMQAMGQATRSVSYTYFHSVVVADAENGQPCAPGSPNCIGGGKKETPATYGLGACERSITIVTFEQGEYERYYKVPDKNLTTLQSLRYILKNKTQGNKVIYDFTVSRGGSGWSSSTPSVTTDPNNDYTLVGSFTQNANIIVNNADGNIKIETPAISLLYANASDDLEQQIIPTSTCTTFVSPIDVGGFNYSSEGCLAVSTITQAIPGIVANNGQTSANGAMLYDVKFSSESADKGGWYLLDGRLVSSITNSSAREAAVMKFGTGAGTRLPDTRDKYSVASNAATAPFTSSGAATTTITANNLPALSGSTTTNGSHSHNLVTKYHDDFNNSGTYANTENFSAPGNDTGLNDISWTNMISGGGHGHSVTVNSASPNTPISIIPPTISLYQFIYLGE